MAESARGKRAILVAVAGAITAERWKTLWSLMMSENSLYICPACHNHNNELFEARPNKLDVLQGVCCDCGCVFSIKYCKQRNVLMEAEDGAQRVFIICKRCSKKIVGILVAKREGWLHYDCPNCGMMTTSEVPKPLEGAKE